MSLEIERKFLLASDDWRGLGEAVLLRQGYLSTQPERIVRVRLAGADAWLTVKGWHEGVVRTEYEYAIPPVDAAEMLERLCWRPLIEKQRTRVAAVGMVWEIDEFLGENAGLIVAEVELRAANQSIELPPWIGREVTGDARYFNSNLLKNPFTRWAEPT